MAEDPNPYNSTSAIEADVSQTSVGWILVATILASSMAFIDSTALNVALPALQADLAATGRELLWIVNAYMLLLSALTLTGGSLGDRYGRKRVFIIGISVFAGASVMAGLSPTSETLILARGFQGIGGALMVPGSLAIISASIPAGERGTAIGTWSAFTTLTTILGPVLGGVLASAGLWRAVFFINVPLAAFALLATARWVPESRDEEATRLDWLGSVVVTLSLAAITYGAIEAPERGLDRPYVGAGLVLGLIGLVAFIFIERWVEKPMVPLSLFKSRDFSGANLLTLMLYAALNAAFFFLSLTLIQAQGYQARQAGFATLPMAVLLALLSRWAGGLVHRYGARGPLIIGPGLAGFGFFGLSLPDLVSGASSYWTTYLPGIALIGVGMGITVAPLTTVVMSAPPQKQVGVASGVNNAIARVAGVLAIAIFGGLALLSFRQVLTTRAQELPLRPQQQTELIAEAEKLGEAEPPPSLSQGEAKQAERAIRLSLLTTFKRTAIASAGLSWLGALAAALLIGREEDGWDPESERAPA
ncbi:MAG: MFS transporter [Anaerolineales bacterium]